MMKSIFASSNLTLLTRVNFICALLLISSCTWTTMRPHLILPSFNNHKTKDVSIESNIFDQNMEKVTRRVRHPHNQLELLRNGDQIFPVVFELIKQAQKRIFIDQYIIRDDALGRKIADALKKRSSEGLDIRIVYDCVGSRTTHHSFWEDLEKHNIKVRPFNPLPWWTIIRFNNRDHRKIMVVDGIMGLVGDFGFSTQYIGDSQTEEGWRTNALLIKGPAVKDLEKVFVESWLQAGHGILKKDLPIPLINTLWKEPLSLFKEPKKVTEKPHPVTLRTMGSVRVISSTPNWGSTEIFDAFLLAFQSSKKTVHVSQSYFILDSRVKNFLLDASKRGVDIKIILPEHYDIPLIKSAAELHYEELLEGGIRIFERKGSMFHVKTIVIDGIWSTIGSCNIDCRSFLLNYECNVTIYNEEFGTTMDKMFEDDLAECKEITLENWKKRSWWKRLKIKLLTPIIRQL